MTDVAPWSLLIQQEILCRSTAHGQSSLSTILASWSSSARLFVVPVASGQALDRLHREVPTGGCVLDRLRWLFSESDRETEISDMVYRIGWHNPINEENDSWLRRALATSQLEEAQLFYQQLNSSTQGEMIHGIWQKFVRDGHESEVAGDTVASQVHSTIAACNEYVRALDEEWVRIADWYSPAVSAQSVLAQRRFTPITLPQ
jgi:hypothetical protein